METRTLFLFGVFFCLVAVATAGDENYGMRKMKKCHSEEINTDEVFKGFKECKENATKEEKTKKEERRRRSSDGGSDSDGGEFMGKNICFAVCAWKAQGLLDESGQFNEAGTKEHGAKVYPEKYRADAFTKIKECATEHSSKFSMDDECKGYKDFKKCVMKAHVDTCSIEMGKGN